MHLLPRMIGYGNAAWALLTAERLSAQDALRMGLVQQVVPAADLLTEALRVAASICALSQVSAATVKPRPPTKTRAASWRQQMLQRDLPVRH